MVLIPDELLNAIVLDSDHSMVKVELTDGVPTWEAPFTLLHQRTVADSPVIPPSGTEGCHAIQNAYVRFPEGSFRSPDLAIYDRDVPDTDGATDVILVVALEVLSPGFEFKDRMAVPFYLAQGVSDVVLVDPHTGEVVHATPRGPDDPHRAGRTGARLRLCGYDPSADIVEPVAIHERKKPQGRPVGLAQTPLPLAERRRRDPEVAGHHGLAHRLPLAQRLDVGRREVGDGHEATLVELAHGGLVHQAVRVEIGHPFVDRRQYGTRVDEFALVLLDRLFDAVERGDGHIPVCSFPRHFLLPIDFSDRIRCFERVELSFARHEQDFPEGLESSKLSGSNVCPSHFWRSPAGRTTGRRS